MDDFNQSTQNGTLADGTVVIYPNDNVTGYTPAVLISLLPLMRGNLSVPGGESIFTAGHDIKTVLKQNKPAGVTNAQLDELFEMYNRYWIVGWINGLWQ